MHPALIWAKHELTSDSLIQLTTRNSFLSTRWLPSVSNILNAIWNPDLGSEKNINIIFGFVELFIWAVKLLVRTDRRNRYSVYEMMPLSRRFRNICDDPFFSSGVLSLNLLMSSVVSLRRFNRAVTKKDSKLVFLIVFYNQVSSMIILTSWLLFDNWV